MKKTISILIVIVMLAGCATTFPRQAITQPAQKVEFTAKQNWINFGIATWQAVIQVVGVGFIMSEMEDGIRDGFGGMRR
ncbi:hypothetical protein LCGC14_2105090 [marine sediment metagenome]|uniref:Lipoprotein n=1 Tax=marine sediment metagenome TaxID=412755 RepID=A0A0F9E901_9ZZZZ|nr:hypothetical protein [Candidatus Aminicenantes bacterium]